MSVQKTAAAKTPYLQFLSILFIKKRNSAHPRSSNLFILTEKPNVSLDFAKALSCTKNGNLYSNKDFVISNCVGHLFKLEEPLHYTKDFLPVIPQKFEYKINETRKSQSLFILSLLKKYKFDEILIATDADREGEIIARECLLMAGLTDFSRIKRFWVSQALTKDVILEGIKSARPLSEYNLLSAQGFSRQHADWLCGMNFSRYMTKNANTKLTVGRVQTAILNAIYERCTEIKNFKTEKYFEIYGTFEPTRVGSTAIQCKGLYFENEINKFPTDKSELKELENLPAKLKSQTEEEKSIFPPELYNLNSLQKDAFKYFEYSAQETLDIIQELYEKLKCVSYPRTPSKVMGSENVELCKQIFETLSKNYPKFQQLFPEENFSLSNTRCFNDKKLEAHHAIIPLNILPEVATEKQKNVYNLILERFFKAFLPEEKYLKQTIILTVNEKTFKISGRKILSPGFKKYENLFSKSQTENQNETEADLQNLSKIDFNSLKLSKIESKEKWTKPPKYFNEASILSFMENPKQNRHVSVEENQKLVGLGTPATRHSFIPKLLKLGYIEIEKKNFLTTKLGENLLSALKSSPLKSVTDIEETTKWEERLSENPQKFETEMKNFVLESVSKNMNLNSADFSQNEILCPICKRPIKESEKSFFCTGYKEGCKFQSLWKETRGTKFSKSDIKSLCEGKKSSLKKCLKKDGSQTYECRFFLNPEKNFSLEPIFEPTRVGRKK